MLNHKCKITIGLFGAITFHGLAQVLTKEDSLKAGLTPKSNPTVISAYGEAKVEYDLQNKTGVANLTRNVLFLGHRFNDKISLFSETEIDVLEEAHRNLFGRDKPIAVAMAEFDMQNGISPLVKRLIEFLERRSTSRHGRFLESELKRKA